MKAAIAAIALTLSTAAPAQTPHPFPGFILARAAANYQALRTGTKQLTDLNAIELREVREIDRLVRAAHVDRDGSRAECIARETNARGGALSDLAARIVDLACSQR